MRIVPLKVAVSPIAVGIFSIAVTVSNTALAGILFFEILLLINPV
jgi:hypothetical protein